MVYVNPFIFPRSKYNFNYRSYFITNSNRLAESKTRSRIYISLYYINCRILKNKISYFRKR